jgi:hypothetical protein
LKFKIKLTKIFNSTSKKFSFHVLYLLEAGGSMIEKISNVIPPNIPSQKGGKTQIKRGAGKFQVTTQTKTKN